MIIVDKSRQNLVGGYEIRRKDWAEVTERFPSFSPEYWDARTVYIENIPHPFRSIVGICNLLRAILNSSPVQHIIFPPHHQDPPDAIPKCKGFALVTLNEPDDVSHLLSRFPYDRDHTPAPTDDISSVDESEARKAGFRALSKERWDGLQAEYVEYRESLLRDMAVDASTVPNYTPNKIESPHGPPDEPQRASGPGVVPAVNLPSYPSGCVLFARHVPPNTNKTALRTLFSALLAYASALDYVDYTKGLTAYCYLRLTTPEHGQALLAAARSKQGDASVQNLELELLEGRGRRCIGRTYPRRYRKIALTRDKTGMETTKAVRAMAVGPGGANVGDNYCKSCSTMTEETANSN
ncbi:hypothetical protein EI94DRAFT_1705720 [Lactarius quietus]|nr:hypothetical protein EI94DRAFT_1705720 [Lactarius quietus]